MGLTDGKVVGVSVGRVEGLVVGKLVGAGYMVMEASQWGKLIFIPSYG